MRRPSRMVTGAAPHNPSSGPVRLCPLPGASFCLRPSEPCSHLPLRPPRSPQGELVLNSPNAWALAGFPDALIRWWPLEPTPVFHTGWWAQEPPGSFCSPPGWLLAWGGAGRCSVYSGHLGVLLSLVYRGACTFPLASRPTSRASVSKSPRIGLSPLWNGQQGLQLTVLYFPSACGLLESRDLGVMTDSLCPRSP